MIQVSNQIEACGGLDNTIELFFDSLSHIVIHRLSLSQFGVDNPDPVPDKMLDSIELCRRFTDRSYPLGRITAWRRPYHLAVLADRDATVEQMIPLSRRGMHAKGYNYRSWGIAVIGNSDQRPPLRAQYDKLVELVALLVQYKDGLRIAGHTSLDGASGDPNKRCPGRFLPVAPVIEAATRQDHYANPRQAMEQAGLVF